MTCEGCGEELQREGRFCTRCGAPTTLQENPFGAPKATPFQGRVGEDLNLQILYGMVALLILAVLFPPWETPPESTPEFLGFHFLSAPPTPLDGEAVISRWLWTVDLTTIAIGGLYLSWVFRKKEGSRR